MANEPQFMPGIDLNRLFFQQVIKPLMDKHFPGLKYAAGIVGEGSDVMRFDTPQSMDHNWGPHMRIFLSEEDLAKNGKAITRMFRKELPLDFMGFPTNFTKPDENSYIVQAMKKIENGPVNHMVELFTVKSFFAHYLSYNPSKRLTYKDWLLFPQQALIEVSWGELYYDKIGFQNIRDKFKYYPDDVWTYMYLIQWDKIANIEAFVGRSAQVGDVIGSSTIASNMVLNIMKLAFLIEKTYTPYIKWFGTAFSRLKCAPELTPVLLDIEHAQTWESREEALGRAYEIVARMHNELRLTRPISTTVKDFNGRPFKVIGAHDVYWDIYKKLPEPFRSFKYKLGSIDQFIAHARINHINYVYTQFRNIIK
ncbi:MAG: hypothetical protein K0S20_550 [Patescibacteria group bacterium]|nr:hypothetical protein [Patescibacteria group bacterium]